MRGTFYCAAAKCKAIASQWTISIAIIRGLLALNPWWERVSGRFEKRFYLGPFLLPGLPQIVGRLHSGPHFRARAQCIRQPQRHVRTDAGAPIENRRHGLARHTQMQRGFGNRNAGFLEV